VALARESVRFGFIARTHCLALSGARVRPPAADARVGHGNHARQMCAAGFTIDAREPARARMTVAGPTIHIEK
jgi:hypothetical protein